MSLVDQLDTVTDASAGTVDRHATTQTFESTNPASGAVVGVFPVHDADAVRETVERARPRRRAVGRPRLRRAAGSGWPPGAATSPAG